MVKDVNSEFQPMRMMEMLKQRLPNHVTAVNSYENALAAHK
jgi:hypothetical protein